MNTNTVLQLEIPNDLPAKRDDQRGAKSDFEFLVFFFVLMVVSFALICAVVYFTDTSNALGGISAESVMAAPPVLPLLP